MKQPLFLSSALAERSTVTALEILVLGDDARGPSSPSRLERSARRVAVTNPAAIDVALAQVADANVVEAAGDLDARFGLVFANAKGQRVLSVYVDRAGERGAIEGHAIALRGQRLIEWIEAAVAAAPVAPS